MTAKRQRGSARTLSDKGCSGSWANDTACGTCKGCRRYVSLVLRDLETKRTTIEHYAKQLQIVTVQAGESDRLRKTAEDEAETMRIRNAELQRMMQCADVATHATPQGLASALHAAGPIAIHGSFFQQKVSVERDAHPSYPADEHVAIRQYSDSGESHIYLTLEGANELHDALAVLLSNSPKPEA